MSDTTPTTPGPVNNPLALAALAVVNQTKRATPELLELVNQVRFALHAAGELETAAEAAFQDAKQVFAGFHTASQLAPLPQRTVPPADDGEGPARQQQIQQWTPPPTPTVVKTDDAPPQAAPAPEIV